MRNGGSRTSAKSTSTCRSITAGTAIPKIDLILRDASGTDVARTKQIVQEFITRDNVAIAGGGEFSPEAFAVADLVTEAKVPYVDL